MNGLKRARDWLYWGPRRRVAFERYLAHLNRSVRMEPTRLDEQRVQSLRRVLGQAYTNVPFQRERLRAAGLVPQRLSTIDDLAALTPVAKPELRALGPDALLDPTMTSKAMWLATSGSSGAPFKFAVDTFFHSRSDACRAFMYARAGFRAGVAVELYAARGTSGKPDPGVGHFRRYIVDYDLPVRDRAPQILALSPQLVYGGRSNLLELGHELERIGATLPRLRHLFSSSEPIDEIDRARLQSVFGVPVWDVYGLAEVGPMFFEIEPGDGYHVIESRVLVEILVDGRPARAGETGEVVVTSLDNCVMPFIRYATGDLATIASGSPSSAQLGMIVERPEGRLIDTLMRMDGSPVTYGSLGTAIWGHPELYGRIRQWQVVQEARDRAVVRVSPTEATLDEVAKARLLEWMRTQFGPGIDVRLEEVGDIPVESNGKYKAVKMTMIRP